MGTQASAPVAAAPELARRKQEVLTRRTPSVARTIADALVMKDGDLFFLSRPDGVVPEGREHGLGLYYHDCRYLDTYELLVAGAPPEPLGCTAAAGRHAIVQLSAADSAGGDRRGAVKDQLGISWDRTLDGIRLVLTDRLTLTNWGQEPLETAIELRFGAGFEDVFQIRGLLREQPGTCDPPAWQDGKLRFGYHGGDEIDRVLTLGFSGGLEATGSTGVGCRVRLPPRGRKVLTVEIAVAERPGSERSSVAAPSHAPRESPHAYAEVRTDSLLLDRLVWRSLADLDLLRSDTEGEEFFAAGVPWFATLFGRDSLISALQILAFDPTVAESTLRLLARFQAEAVDQWRDAEPGKILHEFRVGELAHVGAIPHTPYYGAVDATPLFLVLLARHADWTGDLSLFNELQGNVERALEWIDRYGDTDGDGYIEYDSTTDHGLINQGWKDSGNAIVGRDGRLARPPIALVEVQAYVYRAKRAIAELFQRAGKEARAGRLRREAARLREKFNRDFWADRLGCYVLALEEGKRPLEVVSSNAGHALWAGIADPERAAATAARLMRSDMFSGWGVRTLSTDESGFNPIGYHLGTVWPHDNALIAAGCRRYGLDQTAHRIFGAVAAAASHFEHERLPELFTGFERAEFGEPVRYPVACHPQAWAAGTIPYLLEALLGLEPDGFGRRLRIVRPTLPDFVDRLELRGLQVGAARVSLRFRRTPGSTAVERISTEGELDVVVER